MPAALVRRVLLGAARHQRLPVHRLHLDLEASSLHHRLGDGGEVGQHRQVGRLHQHDRRAVVACLLQKLLGLGGVAVQHAGHAGVARQRRAADERRFADLVPFRVADGGLEEVLLRKGDEHGVTDLGIVERLGRAVEAERVLKPGRVGVEELDVLVAGEQLQQVVARRFDHVDFAVLQRRDLGLRVGHGDPFDAVELDDLATGQA